ncbi:VVA0879 family protein [Melioribacter sp. OK-6-Me]|uniref:VVA0879 family protein n=1 Tax=unclassified Melioribacter TaxID=2627329 RepID=UPI003ED9D165
MKQMKIKEYIDLLRARHGEKIEDWKVICPICKCEQTVQDFLDAGIDIKDVFNYFGFSCIGRFTEAKGCDYICRADRVFLAVKHINDHFFETPWQKLHNGNKPVLDIDTNIYGGGYDVGNAWLRSVIYSNILGKYIMAYVGDSNYCCITITSRFGIVNERRKEPGRRIITINFSPGNRLIIT